MGTYRTAGIYPQRTLLPLPDELSFAEGAGLWLNTLTALAGLDAGRVTPATAAGRTSLGVTRMGRVRVFPPASSSGQRPQPLPTSFMLGSRVSA